MSLLPNNSIMWHSNPMLHVRTTWPRVQKPASKDRLFFVVFFGGGGSTHASNLLGPLFKAMHDYKKSQAINIYIQSY